MRYMYVFGGKKINYNIWLISSCENIVSECIYIYISFFILTVKPSTLWVTSTAATAERSITSGRSRIPMVMRRGNFYLFIYLFFCSVTNNCETSASLPALDTEAGQASPFPPGLNVLCTLIINGESSGDQTLQEHTGNGEVIHWYWNTHYLILKC